jgi:hypothetical protein
MGAPGEPIHLASLHTMILKTKTHPMKLVQIIRLSLVASVCLKAIAADPALTISS